jgi:hypothetical protein
MTLPPSSYKNTSVCQFKDGAAVRTNCFHHSWLRSSFSKRRQKLIIRLARYMLNTGLHDKRKCKEKRLFQSLFLRRREENFRSIMLYISGVLKPQFLVISVRYISSNPSCQDEGLVNLHPGLIGLSIQVFYPSHGFRVWNFSKINLSR